jgi:hypothetical protein
MTTTANSQKVLRCTSCGKILRDTNDIAYQTFETNDPDAAVVDSLCEACFEFASSQYS